MYDLTEALDSDHYLVSSLRSIALTASVNSWFASVTPCFTADLIIVCKITKLIAQRINANSAPKLKHLLVLIGYPQRL